MSIFSVFALESCPLVETTNLAKKFATDGRDHVRVVILDRHSASNNGQTNTPLSGRPVPRDDSSAQEPTDTRSTDGRPIPR
ncbi:hypothetical protein LINPERHAP1_LOCUS6775, partial [Linum perenne]